jgi:simple sugar transport system permease protein
MVEGEGVTTSADAPNRLRNIGRLQPFLLRPEIGALIAMIVVITVIGLLTVGRGFVSAIGFSTVLGLSAHLGIVATFVTLLLIAGEFDLAIGGTIASSTMLIGLFLSIGLPFWLTAILVLTYGLIIGLFHAFLIVRLRFSSFIVTLGSGYLLAGVANFIYSFSEVKADSLVGLIEPSPLVTALTGNLFGVSAAVIWWLVLGLGAWYVLMRTSFGNWIFATGHAPVLARATGVPADRVKTVLYLGTALSAAFLAVMSAAEVNSVNPDRGITQNFTAVIAAALGGGLISGGYGSPLGTMFGVVALSAINQGLYFMQVSPAWYGAAQGVLLLAIVIINGQIRKRALRMG